jgi:ubiquinone/menaquinone biosynthesis C-methylase UbiE
MTDDSWRIWKKYPQYGDLLFKRATGELDEMECSKSLCSVLSPIYEKPMRVLDVGCGSGHYLHSLKKRIDPAINYTGVDATEYYVELARKAFPETQFFIGDIFNLDFLSDSFDIVMCNNLLLHLPPPPTNAIRELLRVSKNYVIIRTLFGERNYLIKEIVKSSELEGSQCREGDLISSDGTVMSYNYFNMYTEEFFRDIIGKIDPDVEITIQSDDNWGSFDNRKIDIRNTATTVMGNKQISGNLILDWRFIILKK